MTSKRRRNSYSDYERRGSLQRRSIHAQNDPVVPSPADLPVQSTLPSRPLKVSSPHSKRRRFSMSSEKTRRLSASGMIANGARKSLAAIKRLFSVHRGSNYSEEYTGKVFWLYHGECTNDEKNSLTGVIDSGLTEFGTYQAEQAGRDACKTMKREKKEFTYVVFEYTFTHHHHYSNPS